MRTVNPGEPVSPSGADSGSVLSRIRLSTRIALAATVLTLSFVLTVGDLSYTVIRKQLIDNQNTALENQAILYAQQIGNTLHSITSTLGTLPKNALILNSLMDSLTRQTALTPFLKDFSRVNDVPVTLLMTDFEGQPVAGNRELSLEAHDWRGRVLETGKPYAAIGTDATGDYLLVAEPIFYAHTLSPEGALLYKIMLANIQSTLPSPGDERTIMRLVYPKPGVAASPAAALSDALQGSEHLAHTEMLSLPTELQPLWIAVEVSTDRSALARSLNRLLLLYAVTGIGMVLTVFPLARAGAHYLTRPLRELEAVAQSIIASGSLEHRFAFHGALEVEQLGRVFNRMLEQLGNAHRQLHRQAEIEVERNQALAAANAALEQEIGERKRAEAALRENEERLRLALEGANQGLYDLNVRTGMAIVSPEYAQMLGYELKEFHETRAAWIERLHPDDRQSVAESYQRYIAGETPDYRMEFRQRAKTGDWIWILSLGSIVQWDDQGEPLRIIGTNTDITQRKQAETLLAKTVEELRVAEQRQRELLAVTKREQGRLRALLAAMNVGILFEDNQQRAEYLNPAFLKMWAIDETLDLVGHPLREILEHSTHRFARPDHASRYVLQVLDTHAISERCEIDLYDGRTLTQMSYPVMDSEDRLLGRLWLYEDITHERQTAQQLLYLAERDPLTGLCNRHSFQKHLEQKIATALRTGDQFAVIYFDLDEFKAINDTFGHRAGDMALVRTAGEITTQVRATEIFARLGGDEFAILSNVGTGHEVGALPTRIVDTISAIPFRFRGTNLRLTASVGIALFPEHGENVEELVAHADTAMYQAKNQGKNSWALYDPSRDSTEAIMRRLNWNSRIAQALEDGLFELHFQGVYHTKNNTLSHLEVLIRIHNPDDPDHPILPGQFIRLAEKSGQVLDIDRWMLKQSIALLGQRPDLPPLAVNISGRTFDDPTLPQFIQRLLTEHNVNSQRLFIELTETAAVSDVQDAQRFIEAIQQLGCGVCLDDFGSGFSTFAYMKYLNVKVLKIDGLFVRDLPNNHDNQVFIRAMVEVARGLRKITVAECVEDAATFDMLRDLGVDLAQGYYLDRPTAEHPALAVNHTDSIGNPFEQASFNSAC
ncbi:MAG: EAL domain-containing protein [Candidatus Competibacteraceae bacterium]|nr:EAL domain-containing protein [Candidatus Competibacteraceae bacterium]